MALVSRPFQLAVFDMGGVLVQCGHTLAEDIEQAGFTVPPSWLEQFEAKLRPLPRRSIGAIDNQQFLTLFTKASDGVFTLDDAQRISDASLVAEYPGISLAFDRLETAGVETALLTNVNDAEWARLFPEGEVQKFPTLLRTRHRFASHLLGVAKPDPEAFLEVERETGHSGDAILFFDDRAENVTTARQLGWTAEPIDHTGDTAAQLLALLEQHGVTA